MNSDKLEFLSTDNETSRRIYALKRISNAFTIFNDYIVCVWENKEFYTEQRNLALTTGCCNTYALQSSVCQNCCPNTLYVTKNCRPPELCHSVVISHRRQNLPSLL